MKKNENRKVTVYLTGNTYINEMVIECEEVTEDSDWVRFWDKDGLQIGAMSTVLVVGWVASKNLTV